MVSLRVWPLPQLIFPSKTWFLEFNWIFSGRNHLKINISHILNPNFTKWISLNPAHQDLSNNTKGTFQFLWKFQLQFNLIFSDKLIWYSRTFAAQVKTSWNQAHAHLLTESFQKTPRTQSEASWFDLVDLISTNKTNKQPFFIDRWIKLLPLPPNCVNNTKLDIIN